jgi:hypothetical protein
MARIVNPSTNYASVTPTTGDRIRALRREADALEDQQHQELAATIAASVASGEVFTAAGLWAQADLRTQCLDADIRSVKQLGHWLQQAGFDRVDRDEAGTLWAVNGAALHDDAGVLVDEDV